MVLGAGGGGGGDEIGRRGVMIYLGNDFPLFEEAANIFCGFEGVHDFFPHQNRKFQPLLAVIVDESLIAQSKCITISDLSIIHYCSNIKKKTIETYSEMQ